MSANAQDFEFEYDKPGAERSRRRRGEDDTLESDLDEDLLDEDWLSSKKNPSEASDEELNDALLQSDDEEMNMSGQDVSLNATYNLGTSYDKQGHSQDLDYADDVMNQSAEGCEEGYVEEEGYEQEGDEAYTQYNQEDNTEMSEDQINYTRRLSEGDDGYQDEVLDLEIDPIDDPIDGDFQDEEYQTSRGDETLDEDGTTQEGTNEVEGKEQQDQEDATEEPVDCDTEEVEHEPLFNDDSKEESNEEEDEDEVSGRMRFKSERKDSPVVRLAAPSSKRRNIPETLELSEEAKKDLMEFEEQERQKRQIRHGGRGGRGGVGGGGGRGGRGRGGFHGFGMPDFRGKRGRMHDQMPPLMGNMGIQPSSRMAPPPHHQQQLQHHPSRPRGPSPFQEHGRPIPQQPLQPLIPHHMAHRSPPMRPQMEPPPRMMNSPPPTFPQHHQQQPPQPKNIHINPHFRGPSQSSVQVPLMPPAQSQTRPAVGPQRFPGPVDFQQHMPGNFGQPQRPPHHMEPLRNQPPQGPQDREPLFMGDSSRFPGQHMFDHQGPGSLMNSSNNLHQQQMPGQGHMGFGPPGPPFNQPGQGPIGLFQREPPRPNLPPHQGHQGMVNFNQQGGPPNQPRPFMGPRQSFGQQGNLFTHPQVQFGMQVRLRLPHHDPLSPHPMHQQQHHRQELPHHHQQQINHGEPRPVMHHGQNPFSQQQAHGSPRQMTPRPQNPQQRNMSNRHRMNTPVSKQMQPRNSNLRELPVAPCNTSTNIGRPTPVPASPAGNIKPVTRTTQGMRPGQNLPPTSGGGRGRGQVAAKSESQLGEAGRTMVNKEIATTTQDPDEDEETRQYRLKIEEQKRLREEILKRKEMRRQMQAGVRKKELLERLNAQTSTPSQGPAPVQTQPTQPNQQTTQQHAVQQQPPPSPIQPVQQQLEQKRQQRLQGQQQQQQQRPFPQRAQQLLNQPLKNPNQGNTTHSSSAAQTPTPRPNVKTRLQMVKGSTQQQQTPGPGPEQQWKQPRLNQQQALQQRSSALQSVSSQVHSVQASEKNIPTNPSVNQGLAQTEGPKLGAKRTVMERTKSSGGESQQVPQKVRVVKLSGLSGKGPEATSGAVQQQGTGQAALLNQGVQRKVTMTGQQQQGPGGTPQAGLGGMADSQQSRVVVSGRGRGRGGGQMGRGRPVTTRLSQRAAENLYCTVSIEGLSSSTTEFQLKSLLKSIGPIEMFKMMPQQRKAVAKFSNPQHAASFQMSFHRHMIDLSHIDVSLIDG
ncbi:RNA-binding protein 33 [Xenentodon cancila]